MREKKFKYEWRRTWDDRPNDFVCIADGYDVGRVYLHTSSQPHFWSWMVNDDRPGRIWSVKGRSETRDAACHALEAAYDHEVEKEKALSRGGDRAF